MLFDGLVPRAIVGLAASARCVSVSKRAGRSTITQDEVSDRMIAAARRGFSSRRAVIRAEPVWVNGNLYGLY